MTSILAPVVPFSGNMWFLGWFSVLQIITPSCSHLLAHLKVFFFSFFSIFWRSRWFKFYPVRSAIYSADVDFNCAIARIASLQGFFFFLNHSQLPFLLNIFILHCVWYGVCTQGALHFRMVSSMVFWYYFYRPIVIEDVNNCLKIFSSCKSFLLLCSPSKSLVLKASESSREIVELASGCILRFSRLCWSMLCPASRRSLGLWPERQMWTAYSTIPGHSQAFVMLVFPERGVKFFPCFQGLTLRHAEIIKCIKNSGPLQGCHLSISVSAQLQSLCGGPKSTTRSIALAAVPSRPYLNERRSQ